MRNTGFAIAILLTAIAAGSASAEEVIIFTNGTVMPIRSHVIEGDLIKVDLGDNGFMAFPKSVVEKIEEAPDLTLAPSTGSNKMFASDPSTRVYGASPRQAAKTWALPTNPGDSSPESTISAVGGVVSKAPFANDSNAALSKVRVNNVPEVREMQRFSPEAQTPGVPQKLPNPDIKKKTLREFAPK